MMSDKNELGTELHIRDRSLFISREARVNMQKNPKIILPPPPPRQTIFVGAPFKLQIFSCTPQHFYQNIHL